MSPGGPRSVKNGCFGPKMTFLGHRHHQQTKMGCKFVEQGRTLSNTFGRVSLGLFFCVCDPFGGPWGAPKVPWRLQNSPKTVYLALITSDALQWVEQGSKLVEHHRTHQGGYVRPLESATGGCQKHLKMAIFDPKMAYLGQKGPFLTLLGSPKDTSLGPYRPK